MTPAVQPSGMPPLPPGFELETVDRGSSFKGSTITVTDPRLNGGKPTNIPDVGDDDADAVADALNSGQEFPSFESVEEAVSAVGKPATPPLPEGFELEGDPANLPPREFDGSNIPGYNPETGEVEEGGASDRIGAFLTGVADLPVVGPAVKAGQRNVAAAAVAPFSDKSFGEIRDEMGRRQEEVVRENPGTALAGNVTGALGAMVPLGATSLGGAALGITGRSLGTRALASGGSSAAINMADTGVRGGDASDIATSGGIGGAIGGAIPVVGAGLNALGRAAKDTIGPRINALVRPTQEAGRRVGKALGMDKANTAAPVLSQADEASAALNKQDILNVDRGGENTRALARSAANTDPEARAIINKTAQDRFASQGDRARSFIDRISGGTADDLALQDRIKEAARKTNRPAYKKAYTEGSDLVKTPELERLMGSPAVVTAMKSAIKSGKDRAVKDGMGTFNPAVSITDDGRVVFNATKPGGGTTFPDLQFWDYTKQELDDMANAAARAGRNGEASTLGGLARALRDELDKVVPSYQTARQGAAAFFDAEDALDAGKKFVTQNRTLDEAKRALDKMNPEERTAFAVGFAAEMKDAIKQSGDSTNVIKKIFGSEQAREKVRLALGPKNYREFEQFVKVENSMDMLRGAMGNSTTTQQLVELGLAGGAGGGVTMLTGDWKQGVTAAVLTGLARRGSAKIDERITKQVAQMLLSDDPKVIERAVAMATKNPAAAKALDAIQSALGSAIKGVQNVSTRKREPLEITVTQPAGVSP